MIKGIQWLRFASLGVVAVLAVVLVAKPAPPALPPCEAEDGGPIPCVWDPVRQGEYHPGDPTAKVTITRAP